MESVNHPVFLKLSRTSEKLWWLSSFHNIWAATISHEMKWSITQRYFMRELLASGDSNTTTLLLDGTYIYIEKSSKYAFQRKSYSVYKFKPISCQNLWWLWHPRDISLTSLARTLQMGTILHKHLSKKKNCISKWSDKCETVVSGNLLLS